MRAVIMVALVVFASWLAIGALTAPPRGMPAPPTAALTAGQEAVPVPSADSAVGSVNHGTEVLSSAVLSSAHLSSAVLRSAHLRNADLVDADWVATVAARTGIPSAALASYAGAALALQAEQPQCRLGWTTLAALGAVESAHGTHAGSSITADGTARPPIYGPALDGGDYANLPDSDGGAIDRAPGGDRAVGPLQFIPSTWQSWGADGNGDGVNDPQQLDDAALAAGRYLCSYGDLSGTMTWRASVFAYNHLESYVDLVASTANDYAREAE